MPATTLSGLCTFSASAFLLQKTVFCIYVRAVGPNTTPFDQTRRRRSAESYYFCVVNLPHYQARRFRRVHRRRRNAESFKFAKTIFCGRRCCRNRIVLRFPSVHSTGRGRLGRPESPSCSRPTIVSSRRVYIIQICCRSQSNAENNIG